MENTYGVRLCKSMREEILNRMEIAKYDQNKSERLMFIIGSNIGFRKFKSIEDIVDNKMNRERFDKILRNESIFDGKLGLSLMQFFDIKPTRVIIYEDVDNYGRSIKDLKGDQLLFFIPVYNASEMQNSTLNSVDSDIKKWNNIAENDYDIIEGRYITNKNINMKNGGNFAYTNIASRAIN